MESASGVRTTTMLGSGATKIVFVVAHAGALFQCLARTMQDRLHGCEIYVIEVGARLPDLEDGPRLVLVDAAFGGDIAALVAGYRARYQDAAIALLLDEPDGQSDQCDMLFASGTVQGLLPWTLKLEVWLAALSLLLSGGDYYPSERRHTRGTSASVPHAAKQAAHIGRTGAAASAGSPLACLTARETQILELLSEGHQNKLIAHKMSLSEHTVKVHVHNLLSKLHVTNRTQAAAAYRGRNSGVAVMSQGPDTPSAGIRIGS